MAVKIIVNHPHEKGIKKLVWRFRLLVDERPGTAFASLLGVGILVGVAIGAEVGWLQMSYLRDKIDMQQTEIAQIQRDSQSEINALAARLGELQAQATRLNALGERLTQMGQLQDGEFDFNEPVGVGGGDEGPAEDMPLDDFTSSLNQLEEQFFASGKQLNVLESLLFDQKLDQNATPSRAPVHNSYITSGFGGRADPFGRGARHHAGIDFHAQYGDPVLCVADGVVSFSGVKGGYGNVVDVDHGNGYVTRYAHNSRLTVKEGDLVRVGQEIAKAGSTGRSTGVHVHFEVWENNNPVNPRQFLLDGNTPVGKQGRG